jgi:hypothetical protein
MDISVKIPGTWTTGAFQAGDVLIFADTTVHKALPNKSRVIRQSFDARYQPASKDIAEPNLQTYSGTGAWEGIYAGWRSKIGQYYWKTLALSIVDFDTSYYEARDKMAFKMAEKGDLLARDTLLRIIQRDTNEVKIRRAKNLIETIDKTNSTNL